MTIPHWLKPKLPLIASSLPSLSADEQTILTRSLQTVRQELARQQRLPLETWARKYLPHYLTSGPSRMHEWLTVRLEELHVRRGQRIAIIAPRGSAKTTWISKAFPLYCTVHGIEPYILLISDTAVQAEKNLEAIRYELESNPELARDFPQACGVGPVWNNQRVETRHRVCIEALGMGSRIRGRTFGPHRPTLMIVDDLDNDESVESPLLREKTFNWLQRAVIPAGTGSTNVFVLGTALHRDDVLQKLRRTPGWESRTFPSILAEPRRQDLWDRWEKIYRGRDTENSAENGMTASSRTKAPDPLDFSPAAASGAARAFFTDHREEMLKEAQVLWPEREPLYDLMCLRATIGEAAFQAEKQGNPTSTRTAEWPADCFGESIWFDDWPDDRLRVMALDPSKGQTETSDFSAFVMLALGRDGLMYVDADLKRRDTTQIVEDGIKLLRDFRPRAMSIESNSFQELLKDQFAHAAGRAGLLVTLFGVPNVLSKRVRIRTLTPHIRYGHLRFRRGSEGAERLVEQLREFPSGRHDDGPDALELAYRLLQDLLADEEPPPVEQIEYAIA